MKNSSILEDIELEDIELESNANSDSKINPESSKESLEHTIISKDYEKSPEIDRNVDVANSDHAKTVLTMNFSSASLLSLGRTRKLAKKKISPKKLNCNICGKSFAKESSRNSHVKSAHENEKAHKCNRCDYASSIMSNLKKHIKVKHEGFKPHKCDQCQAAFSEKTGLKVHIANKHGDETFRCEYCDRKFGVKGNVIRHVKNVHNIIEVPIELLNS